MSDTTTDTFDIALVMAGAISAGAYTAGVIDFLLEALDQWEQARLSDPTHTPQHRVRIRVIAGASAGGMTAALLGSVIQRALPTVDSNGVAPASPHPLYDAWVAGIDLQTLLATDDLPNTNTPVRSLLNSNALDTLADRVFTDGTHLAAPRPYFAESVDLFLTLTNLAGVPYKIPMVNKPLAHAMRLHKDFVHFSLGPTSLACSPDCVPVNDLTHANWQAVRNAALASGAFPIGLAGRTVARCGGDYKTRLSSSDTQAGPGEPILPDWDLNDTDHYATACVDGGLMDNEPLELARRALAGSDGHNPRQADRAHRAVLLIDPFPDSFHLSAADAAKPPATGLTAVLAGLLPALKNQARFKPEELQLAVDENVYSRFLIAPIRDDATGRQQTNIACGALGGFGGFIDRAFREHDYQLGRRNCQRFLQTAFTLPPDNVVMRHWGDAEREPSQTADGQLPIVPLFGTARTEVRPLPWPCVDKAFVRDTFTRPVTTRLLRVIRALLAQSDLGGLTRAAADLLVRLLKGNVMNFVIGRMIKSLAENGQLIARPARSSSAAVTFGPRR